MWNVLRRKDYTCIWESVLEATVEFQFYSLVLGLVISLAINIFSIFEGKFPSNLYFIYVINLSIPEQMQDSLPPQNFYPQYLKKYFY